MGFSDHIPMRFPDGHESPWRVPTEKVEDYIATIRALREEYRGKIELHIGFEMEYYPEYFEQMLENAKKWGGEYLILGQHFVGNEYPAAVPSSAETDDIPTLKTYVSCVTAGIKSGAFSFVAHPDMFRFKAQTVQTRAAFDIEMRKICVASREYNVPLEYNLLGVRAKRHYPRDDFWRIAGEEKCPVVFGFDAHDVNAAFDGESLPKAFRKVEELGLNFIPDPKLIDITEEK